jgi:hypothetical protein
VTANNFPYTAFNVTVPLSDAAYKQGCKEGDVSYIRPASTFTNMKDLVDVFSFHVKTSYRNRQSVDLHLSRERQKQGSVGRNRLFQDSDTHIQGDAASQTVITKSESVTR